VCVCVCVCVCIYIYIYIYIYTGCLKKSMNPLLADSMESKTKVLRKYGYNISFKL